MRSTRTFPLRRDQTSTFGSLSCLFLLLALATWPAPGNLSAAEKLSPPLLPSEVSEQVRRAIDKGLKYLADSQLRNGSYGVSRRVSTSYPTAMSSLVGLVFFASGSTPTRGPYARQIQRIADYLLNHAVRQDGLLVDDRYSEQRPMYGHAFAMTFLAMVYGQEGDLARRQRIQKVLQRAIRLTVEVQTGDGGWGYQADYRTSDEGTLTVTQTQALRACRDAGLQVPRQVIDNAVRYIKDSTNSNGSVRYSANGNREVRPGVTCAALVTLWNAGLYDDRYLKRIADYINSTIGPRWKGAWDAQWTGYHHGEYVLYYLAQAKFVLGTKDWTDFYRVVADQVIASQQAEGHWVGKDGSGLSRFWSYGEIYSTAIALLVLQLPFKRLPVYQR